MRFKNGVEFSRCPSIMSSIRPRPRCLAACILCQDEQQEHPLHICSSVYREDRKLAIPLLRSDLLLTFR